MFLDHLLKTKKKHKNLKKEDARYFYQNVLDKASFQNNIAYESFKTLSRRTASDKVLRDKAFNIAKNPKYQCGVVSMVYKFFDK